MNTCLRVLRNLNYAVKRNDGTAVCSTAPPRSPRSWVQPSVMLRGRVKAHASARLFPRCSRTPWVPGLFLRGLLSPRAPRTLLQLSWGCPEHGTLWPPSPAPLRLPRRASGPGSASACSLPRYPSVLQHQIFHNIFFPSSAPSIFSQIASSLYFLFYLLPSFLILHDITELLWNG